jgi:hypothetical protein
MKKWLLDKLGLVTRAELAEVQRERDEYKKQTIALESRIAALELLTSRKTTKKRRWPAFLTGLWLLVIGVFVGVLVPKGESPQLQPDYANCISDARYNAPIAGNQYQELVNALYACEIYKVEE